MPIIKETHYQGIKQTFFDLSGKKGKRAEEKRL
jgi:hypothetical protein